MKILLVDDDEMNLKILMNILEGAQHDVIIARDGQEGIELLKSHPDVQIILLDRMMPNMDGMQFLKAMSDIPNRPPCKVIMQTAANEPRDVIEGNAAGVYYYLTKPFDEDMALSVVASAVQDLQSLANN